MNINTDIFKIQSNNVMPSRGKILISEPFLHDVTFGRSVVLLVDHTEEGSMGLIINKPLPLMLNDIIKEFKYIEDIPLHKGGPIGTDTLFYLHTLHEIPGTSDQQWIISQRRFRCYQEIHFTRKPYKRKDTLFPRIFRLGMRTTDSGDKGEYLDYFKRRKYLLNE